MGNYRLGELPRTQKWQDVVDMIDCGANVPQVARTTLAAAEKQFLAAADDPSVVHSAWLLMQLPHAARTGNLADALRDIGVAVDGPPTLMELTAAISEGLDSHTITHRNRSDFGEMASQSLVESLQETVAPRLTSLFSTSPADVERELGSLAGPKGIGTLAHAFFARLTERYLDYFLSRTMSTQVGPNMRFATLSEKREFDKALRLHARQAATVMQRFAGEWAAKTNWEKRTVSKQDTARFVFGAMSKLVGELRRGAGFDGE